MENTESAKIEPKYFGATPSSVESNNAQGKGSIQKSGSPLLADQQISRLSNGRSKINGNKIIFTAFNQD